MKIGHSFILLFIVGGFLYIIYSIFLLKEVFTIQNAISLLIATGGIVNLFATANDRVSSEIKDLKSKIEALKFRNTSGTTIIGFEGVRVLIDELWPEEIVSQFDRTSLSKGKKLILKNSEQIKAMLHEINDRIELSNNKRLLRKKIKTIQDRQLERIIKRVEAYPKKYFKQFKNDYGDEVSPYPEDSGLQEIQYLIMKTKSKLKIK